MSDPQPDFRAGSPFEQGPALPPPAYQDQPPATEQGYGQPWPQAPGYGQQPYAQPAYPPQPYPQQFYGQQAGGLQPYGYQSVEHPQSQMVFILGILGIVTGVTAFVAWYMGGQAKKEIDAGAPYQWGGQLKTGYVLGKVFGILTIVGVSLLVLIYAAYFIFLFWMIGSMG